MNRKQLIIAVSITVAVAIIGGFAYSKWTKSPQYSLKQVREAFEKHDVISFEKYVDINDVATRYMDDAIASELGDETEGDDWASGLAQGMVQMMKPQLVNMIEEQVKALVEDEQLPTEEEAEEVDAINLLSFFAEDKQNELEYTGIEDVRKAGNIATLTLGFHHDKYDANPVLEVKMRKMDGYWQVAELPNAVVFFGELEDIQEKILAEKNAPLVEQIKQAISVNNVRKYEYSGAYGFETKAVFDIDIANVGDKKITTYYGSIVAKDKAGNLIKEITFADDSGLNVGEARTDTWSLDTNQFIEAENTLYETPNENMDIDVKMFGIEFEDGSNIKLFE
ncbi:MAG: hypothetical protein PHX87_00820 [Candidatus Peribacteraceae bacterium]|nr:hypothetical protein [Candidatus Peribacteraceae bacterium]